MVIIREGVWSGRPSLTKEEEWVLVVWCGLKSFARKEEFMNPSSCANGYRKWTRLKVINGEGWTWDIDSTQYVPHMTQLFGSMEKAWSTLVASLSAKGLLKTNSAGISQLTPNGETIFKVLKA